MSAHRGTQSRAHHFHTIWSRWRRALRANLQAKPWIISLSCFVLLFGGVVFFSHRDAQAITVPTSVRTHLHSDILDAESGCTSDLAYQNATYPSKSPRNRVNDSNPYRELRWITPAGSPASDVTATANDPSPIPLQLNTMDFICAILTKPNSNRVTPLSYTKVTSSNFPNDRGVNPDGTDYDAASRYQLRTRIVSANVSSGPGSLSGVDVGRVLTLGRDGNTRYWGSDAVEPFNYVPPAGGLTGNTTVTIRFMTNRVFTYHDYYGGSGDVTYCTNQAGNSIQIFSLDYSKCGAFATYVVLPIAVHNPGITSLNVTSDCSALRGVARDSDSPDSTLRIYVYEDAYAAANLKFGPLVADRGSNGHSFSAPIGTLTGSDSTDWKTHTFYIRANGVGANGKEDGKNTVVTFKVGPCVHPACSASLSNFTVLGVGIPTTFHVGVTATNGSTNPPGNPTFNIKVTGTGAGANSQSYNGVPDKPISGGNILSNDVSFTPAAPGSYSVTWSYGSYASGCNDTPAKAGFTPYFSVIGGDVSAGAGFGDGCTDDSTATISAVNLGLSGGYKGAASTLGSFALSTITGFASGTNGETGASTSNVGNQPKGLAFANTTSNLGNFGSLGCVPDYASEVTNTGVTPILDDDTQTVDVGTLASGTYVFNNSSADSGLYNGRLVITGGTIPADTHITIVANSDIEITGDITYGSYSSLSHAPRLTIIANAGNLYLSHDVNRLDGFYVAQPNGSNTGTIYTCTDDSGNESIDPALCSGAGSGSTLEINGAVSAGAIRFDRTYSKVGSEPSERITFSPELWSAGLSSCASDISLCSNTDDSITGLPPVL